MPTIRTEGRGAIEIYYEEQGRGEPVVLIGGGSSTAEVWGYQVPALAARNRVITPDNRGSGRTRVEDDDGVRTPARFAGDVLALLDALALERAHLVGASMGGMIAQEFALRHPDRTASLVIACSSFCVPPAVAAGEEVSRAWFSGSAEGASPEQVRAAVEVLVHPETREKRKERLDFYLSTKVRHPHSAEELVRRAIGLASFDVHDRLAELRVPTLVLAGSHDVLMPPENARLLARRIQAAEIQTIDEAGHMFFIEQPDASNRLLLDFLGRHPLKPEP